MIFERGWSIISNYYFLNDDQINYMRVFLKDIQQWYSESDSTVIRIIMSDAIRNATILQEDLYKLLEVLPRIIPVVDTESVTVTADELESDWTKYIFSRREKYKRDMEQIRRILTNLLFIQNAVHQRKLSSLSRPFIYNRNRGKEQIDGR